MMEKSTPNATSTVDGIGPRINDMDRYTLKQNTNSISTKMKLDLYKIQTRSQQNETRSQQNTNSILTKYKLDLNKIQTRSQQNTNSISTK